jgi:hypothetical protein
MLMRGKGGSFGPFGGDATSMHGNPMYRTTCGLSTSSGCGSDGSTATYPTQFPPKGPVRQPGTVSLQRKPAHLLSCEKSPLLAPKQMKSSAATSSPRPLSRHSGFRHFPLVTQHPPSHPGATNGLTAAQKFACPGPAASLHMDGCFGQTAEPWSTISTPACAVGSEGMLTEVGTGTYTMSGISVAGAVVKQQQQQQGEAEAVFG